MTTRAQRRTRLAANDPTLRRNRLLALIEEQPAGFMRHPLVNEFALDEIADAISAFYSRERVTIHGTHRADLAHFRALDAVTPPVNAKRNIARPRPRERARLNADNGARVDDVVIVAHVDGTREVRSAADFRLPAAVRRQRKILQLRELLASSALMEDSRIARIRERLARLETLPAPRENRSTPTTPTTPAHVERIEHDHALLARMRSIHVGADDSN